MIEQKKSPIEEVRTILGLSIFLHTDFASAEERVLRELTIEGFGVYTELDVRETLKKKLDVDFRPYKILSAYNPPLAYQALSQASEVGLLLPCNITIAQVGEDQVEVCMADPLTMMAIIDRPEMAIIARDARARLERVITALAN